ncbi:XRE family transcriptional regulator [Phytohabitans sp. ZYX-F-186]|uniref:XRE family transcriptional regulator n=1 Tax=Phytohabitans maris TaxID=3071409 RepID=A0ABU0ZV75_9ACTN|nr:XRE family transcriptional regulator [Phytohabitans sp. ZYX-F-186]MDQ7910949.1 XRE family transcriptional regulator [Phytohabitans sp. ZYX-F-186]
MTIPAEPRTLADKINQLFRTIHPRDRGPYSNEEVASAIRDGGESMSATYLWMLRRGERTNPTMRHLQALAGFFGVAPAYFFDEAVTRRTDRDLELLSSLRQLGAKRVALRTVLESAGLSEASQRLVQQVVDRCLELEGLSDAAKPEAPSGASRREARS